LFYDAQETEESAMIIIGELINASRNAVKTAIEEKDAETIATLAVDQAQAGADYIDVNAGIFVGKEPEYLKWLVETVQAATDKPCAIDSPDPAAVETALAVHDRVAMINSISLEKERYDALLPIVAGTDLKIIALCMSDDGMPQTVDDRMKIADKLVNGLVQNNVAVENIFVDPLVQPVSIDGRFGLEFVNSIEKIRETWPGIHTACGLSNISYGLPGRKYLNRAFMIQAIAKGLDGALINPLDKGMMASILLGEVLSGKDDFCMNYLKGYRAGLIEDQQQSGQNG
jgi:5-methyltetrahydrofolate--homocysteine methyltransferase